MCFIYTLLQITLYNRLICKITKIRLNKCMFTLFNHHHYYYYYYYFEFCKTDFSNSVHNFTYQVVLYFLSSLVLHSSLFIFLGLALIALCVCVRSTNCLAILGTEFCKTHFKNLQPYSSNSDNN
jgi:hypothetical protein